MHKTKCAIGISAAMVILLCVTARAGEITLLHEFSGGADDGSSPYYSDLTLSGNTLYGMTNVGGNNNYGTIFSVGIDGTGFTLLHEFSGQTNDGKNPYGDLTLSGSTLYGMTNYGGVSGRGTIFSVETNGTGFNVIHDFAYAADNGQYPLGSVTLSGSTLYGMTYQGTSISNIDKGTIFSVETNGTGFTVLHDFVGGVTDGQSPLGNLTLSGSTLYGMTTSGGDYDKGTIFSVGIDGTGFTLLHEFAGGQMTDITLKAI